MNKEMKELYYTELEVNKIQVIEIDEKNKEFKLYEVDELDDIDLYTFVSSNTMNAIILGLKTLEFVLTE